MRKRLAGANDDDRISVSGTGVETGISSPDAAGQGNGLDDLQPVVPGAPGDLELPAQGFFGEVHFSSLSGSLGACLYYLI